MAIKKRRGSITNFNQIKITYIAIFHLTTAKLEDVISSKYKKIYLVIGLFHLLRNKSHNKNKSLVTIVKAIIPIYFLIKDTFLFINE